LSAESKKERSDIATSAHNTKKKTKKKKKKNKKKTEEAEAIERKRNPQDLKNARRPNVLNGEAGKDLVHFISKIGERWGFLKEGQRMQQANATDG